MQFVVSLAVANHAEALIPLPRARPQVACEPRKGPLRAIQNKAMQGDLYVRLSGIHNSDKTPNVYERTLYRVLQEGQQLIREGKLEEALALYRQTLQPSPTSLPANVAAGSVLDLMGFVTHPRRRVCGFLSTLVIWKPVTNGSTMCFPLGLFRKERPSYNPAMLAFLWGRCGNHQGD
jgi:hypothetical protein